jgi:microcystin degradation protein MlrC
MQESHLVKRVLTGRFMHETNTFSVQKTDMALWRRRDFHLGNEIPAAFRNTRSALGATFEAADKFGWVLVHPVSANANPSGIVTDDAFEQIGGMLLDAAELGPIDGVLLHLHGAMVVQSYEDGEGELLARLRKILGPDVPVVVTLDLHANVTQLMADNASALIAFRTYPHVDQYERAWQGAELLERAMQGEVRPRTVIARRPMIYGLDRGRHQAGPMAELIARGEALETAGDILVASACAGFSRANIHDVGPSVTVTVDMSRGDARLHGQTIAEGFMDHAWDTRDYESFKLLSVEEAVARAREGKPGDKPLVVADYTDNPGGGGYGDATAFLKGLVEAGVERVAFHAICDPEAVMEGMRAGVGVPTTITLGGKTDPRVGGEPLTLTGEVTHLTNGKFIAYGPMGGGLERDYGPSMVFRVGGIDIVAISNNGQAVDLAQFTSLGIDPTRYTTVCVKSMQHFRAAFEPIAREIILVDTGALCSETYTAELFDKVRRPVWPLDEIA